MFKLLVLQQAEIVRNDRWLLAMLTIIPIALSLCIWWIFSKGIATELPVAVVDLDKSELSRMLSRDYDATATLKVTRQYASVQEAKAALQAADIYAYWVIPKNFQRKVMLATSPQVSVFYNSQYILIGRLIQSAVLSAQGTFDAKVDVIRNLAKGDTLSLQAFGRSVPLRVQVTSLFNLSTNYAQFLVTAIIPAMWQIFIIVSCIMILAANKRYLGLKNWLQDAPFKRVVVTLLCYSPIFILQGIAFIIWFFVGLQFPMNGSWLLILAAQLCMIFAVMGMAGVCYFSSMDTARSLSIAGAYSAPAFAFLGVTFPVSDMSPLALAWRNILPVSHYIEVQISEANYGYRFEQFASPTLAMLGFSLAWLVMFVLIKKRIVPLINSATKGEL